MQSHEEWESRAQLLCLLARPARLTILEALCEGPLCVNDLTGAVTMPRRRCHSTWRLFASGGLLLAMLTVTFAATTSPNQLW
jgi:DNA-binding transcriptional ArsR family regulator